MLQRGHCAQPARRCMVKSKAYFAIGLASGLALLAAMVILRGPQAAWKPWNIPASDLRFMDAQVFGAAALTHAEGRDPLRENPHDVDERRLNYPRIWHLLFAAGFKREHAGALGACFVASLLVGLCLLVPPLTKAESAVMLLAVFSPAVLLGIERGNSDLGMLFLLALAVVVPRTTWAAGLVLLAFMLKLFPLAGVAALLGRPREEAMRAIGVVLALAVLYLCYNLGDLLLINAATPRGAWIAYGWQVPALRWADAEGRADPTILLAVAGAVFAVAGTSLWAGAKRGARRVTTEGKGLDAFRLGAACYAGSFLLGSSFHYRLIFLLPALPQLIEWARQAGPGCGWARLGVASALLSFWALGLDGVLQSWPTALLAGFWAAQAANWVMFGVSLYFLASTLPDWCAGPLRRWTRAETSPAAPESGSPWP